MQSNDVRTVTADADVMAALELVATAALFLDQHGRLQGYSPNIEDLFDIRVDDIGRPLSQVPHRFYKFPTLTDRGIDGSGEIEVMTDDGRQFLRRVAARRDDRGADKGQIVTFTELPPKSHVADRLRRNESRFRMAQEASPEGFILFDTLRDPKGQITDFAITYANAASAIILEKSVEELQGQHLLALFPQVAETGVFTEFVKVVETGESLMSEFVDEHRPEKMWIRLAATQVEDGLAVQFNDITDRKEDELQVTEGTDRLQRILDSVVAFVGALTPEGILQEVNQPALDIAGLTRDDVIGKPFWDAHWWAYDETVQAQLKGAVARAARGETLRYDVQICIAQDHFIYIDFQLVPILNGAGDVVELIPSGVDINDRMRFEEELRENANQLTQTLDGVATLIGLLNVDGTVRDINATAMSAIAEGKDVIVGAYFPDTPWWDISEDVRARVAEMINTAASGKLCRADLPWLTGAGEQRWVDFTVAPVKASDGRVVAIVPSGNDITERKQNQHALEDSQERLEMATVAAKLGTFDFDVKGSIINWDTRAVEILGLSEPQIRFEEFLRRIHKADRAGLIANVSAGLDPEQTERFKADEYRFLKEDGTEVWIEGHASFVLGENGRAVGTVQDITPRKRAQNHQELLLNELNHRVKNSLATIQAIASHTLRSAPSPEAFREAFSGRLAAIASAHNILVGNEQAGADLADLIRSQIGPYADLAAGQVQFSGPPVTVSPTVSHALGLIMHELATNAAKYGAFSVATGLLSISWVLVRDQGRECVQISWNESGGPPVVAPAKKGFGSRLIDMTLSQSLDGHVKMTYDHSGFCAELLTPLVADDDA